MSVEGLKRKVGEMGRVQGGRQRSPHLVEGPMTPYLRVANVFDGYIDTSDVLEMPFSAAEYERYELKPGDLLLNEGQSLELVGRCAKYEGLPKGCCFQNTLVRFQAGPECDTDYAYQLFRWCQYTGIFALIATKTNSIAHLGSTRFAELALPFPPLPEQRKIAAILSTWDDALATLGQLLEAKRQQKRGLAEALLTGKKRVKGFEGEWEITQLGRHIFEVSARNKGSQIERVLSVTNHSGFVLPEEQFSKRVASENISNYKIVRRGQFAYNPSRLNVGSLARLDSFDEGVVSPLYVVFDVRNSLCREYLLYWLESPLAENKIKASVQGSVRDSVNFDALAGFSLALPPLLEQQAIASILSTLDAEIASLEALKAKVQGQKRGLMDELLTGRVRVRVEHA